MDKIKKIPLPIAGLILALATSGNMLSYISNNIRYGFGIIAGILYILLIIKILTNLSSVKKDLENPVMITVMATFDMALMVLSTYIAILSMPVALGLWIVGIIIHCIIIVYVTIKYIVKFDIKKIFATYFVSYVGIIVASITSPVFKLQQLGKIAFYFGFIAYIILLPIVFYRVYKVKNIPEAAFPTCAIIAAPASLCLAGYVNSFGKDANPYFICGLGIFSIIMTIIGLTFIPKVVKGKFYPSFAALTFPFIISPFAMRLSSVYLKNNESFKTMGDVFGFIYNIEVIFGIIIVAFVFLKYAQFILKDEKRAASLA